MIKKILLILLGSCTLALFGCAEHHRHNPPDMAPPSTACQTIPYLQKYDCSVEKLELLAENGDADAEYALGYMYYYGIGTDTDQEGGIAWMRASAGQGNTNAIEALKALDLYNYPKMGRIAKLRK